MVIKHRKHSDTDWSLPVERIDKLNAFAKTIEPEDLTKLNERLFKQNEWDLYEEKGDWQAQKEKLQQRRNQAVKAILEQDGLDAVIVFSGKVEVR